MSEGNASASAACERVRARIAAVCDRSLPPLEQARDEGHLEACADCAALAAAHAAWLVDLRAHLAPGLADVRAAQRGLDTRLAGARDPRAAARARWVGAAAVAAACVAVLSLLQSNTALDLPLDGVFAAAHRVGIRAVAEPAWPSFPDALGLGASGR